MAKKPLATRNNVVTCCVRLHGPLVYNAAAPLPCHIFFTAEGTLGSVNETSRGLSTCIHKEGRFTNASSLGLISRFTAGL